MPWGLVPAEGRGEEVLEKVEVFRELGLRVSGFGSCANSVNETTPAHVRITLLMKYRYEALSFEGLLQQVVLYIRLGYVFTVVGQIPEGKAPEGVDRKIIDRYGIGASRWYRAQRKRAGKANLQYVRWERTFVILSTPGEHRFFEDERSVIRNVRRDAMTLGPYSVGWKRGYDGKWHSSVRIHPKEYIRLRDYLVGIAC